VPILYYNTKQEGTNQAIEIDMLVLSNLEVLNAEYMEMGIGKEERQKALNMKAKRFREILQDSEALKRINLRLKNKPYLWQTPNS
jgi:hypothetical protein